MESAVAEAAQATPAARPVAWSSGRMSQPLSTREIWCWGPPRQAWASTTTGTIGRMRALAGLGGERAVLVLVLGDQFAGGGAAGGVQGGGVGFLGGGFGEPGGHGLAFLGGRCLDRFLDFGGYRDRQFPCGHACHRSAR